MSNPAAAPARNFTVSAARCSLSDTDGRAGSCARAELARNTRISTAAPKLHFWPQDGRNRMLETIAIILIVLWLLGMVSGYTMGNFIYVLLVIAIVLFLVRLISCLLYTSDAADE